MAKTPFKNATFLQALFPVLGLIPIIAYGLIIRPKVQGLALIGVAAPINANLAITAGAIIGGAFFGDKMSPLSDTTNVAVSFL